MLVNLAFAFCFIRVFFVAKFNEKVFVKTLVYTCSFC